MFQVNGSESTRTGLAPARMTAAAQEMMVKVGMITSSPSWIPKAEMAASKAIEPLQTAMPCLRLTRAAIRSSNCLTKGPSEEIQPDSMHACR
ncbi:hypothetical protein D3C87_848120 [compost metagenome]